MTVLTQVAANVRHDTTKATGRGIVSAAITAGMIIKRNTTLNTWSPFDADEASAETFLELAMAINSAPGVGQMVEFQQIDGAQVNPGAAVVVGTSYWLAGTAGGIQDAAPDTGDKAVFIGVAVTTALISLCLRNFAVSAP